MLAISGTSDLKDISEQVNISTTSISNWIKKADEEGFESLRQKPIPSRLPRLTLSQKNEIIRYLIDDPNKHGYRVWDGVSLSKLIYEKFNVTLKVRQCQYLLHKHGFSLVRPQPFPCKDPDDQRRLDFKKLQI